MSDPHAHHCHHHGHAATVQARSRPSVPAAQQPAESCTRYTCPMHPEIVRDAPGHCPICGMALEPMMPSADDEEIAGAAGLLAPLLVDAAAHARRAGARDARATARIC